MRYYDYEWDLYSDKIVLDTELDTNKLTWETGQYWQLCVEDGKRLLRRVDPLVQFLIEGKQERVNE